MIVNIKKKEYKELEFSEENPPAILKKKDGSMYLVLGTPKKRIFKRIK